MKKLIIIIMVVFSFSAIENSKVYAYGDGLSQDLNAPKGMLSGLVDVYNILIEKTQDTIQSNMNTLKNSASKLLITMCIIFVVVSVGRSWLAGQYLLTDSVLKTGVMIGLLFLLDYRWYDKYILSNLEALFNNLPTVLGSNNGSSAIENIINQTSSIADEIFTKMMEIKWNMVINILLGSLSLLALILLTGVVVLNVLFATIKFYIVLSLSSIWIVLFFFKFTRSFAMGAIQVVFGAIINITLLSMFLNLWGSVMNGLLKFDGNDYFISCISIVIISGVGVALVGVVNEIAQTITAQTIQTGGSMASLTPIGRNLTKLFKKPAG